MFDHLSSHSFRAFRRAATFAAVLALAGTAALVTGCGASQAQPNTPPALRTLPPRLSETGLWDTGFQFGDWLDPTAPPDNPIAAKANSGVVATACLYRSASFTAARR